MEKADRARLDERMGVISSFLLIRSITSSIGMRDRSRGYKASESAIMLNERWLKTWVDTSSSASPISAPFADRTRKTASEAYCLGMANKMLAAASRPANSAARKILLKFHVLSCIASAPFSMFADVRQFGG